MGALTDAEFQAKANASRLRPKYQDAVDRESARERLAARAAPAPQAEPMGRSEPMQAPTTTRSRRTPKEPPTALETIVKSPMARTIAGAVTRGLMGALLRRR